MTDYNAQVICVQPADPLHQMIADDLALNTSSILTDSVKKKACELGFTMAGVVSARPSVHLTAYLDWIAREMHGEMGYLARPDRLARRRDLNAILPGVQSIVVVGLDYFTQRLPLEIATDPGRGRISNYAWGVDYHDVMTPRLHELAAWLASATGGAVQSKVYVDTGAILERDLGVSAELGFTGKNTMLINPRRGSFFFLGELLTTAVLTPDPQRRAMPGCGSCTRCLTACPTDAFPRPYVLDARRCISYLTIELKGSIPRELRPLMGNWVYGCDICQDVCPFNRFAAPTNESFFLADTLDSAAPRLLDLLTMDENAFQTRFKNSPIKRIKRQRLVRNACVAAGNWGAQAAVAPLIALLDDAEPLVREHAAWALGQIGDRDGLAAVREKFSAEADAEVRQEMSQILQ